MGRVSLMNNLHTFNLNGILTFSAGLGEGCGCPQQSAQCIWRWYTATASVPVVDAPILDGLLANCHHILAGHFLVSSDAVMPHCVCLAPRDADKGIEKKLSLANIVTSG